MKFGFHSNMYLHNIKKIEVTEVTQLSEGTYTQKITFTADNNEKFELDFFSENGGVFLQSTENEV